MNKYLDLIRGLAAIAVFIGYFRYWSVRKLSNSFNNSLGNSTIEVDGFFGLGIQKSDIDIMPNKYKMAIVSSELLRGISNVITPIKYLADSLYVESTRST